MASSVVVVSCQCTTSPHVVLLMPKEMLGARVVCIVREIRSSLSLPKKDKDVVLDDDL